MLSVRPERTGPEQRRSEPIGSQPPGSTPGEAGLERAIGLAFALIGFVVAAGVMTDNSLLTHLATGRLILEDGSVPSVDPYSRFGAGEAWTVQSWLVSVLYAVLDGVGGPGAIRVFHGATGALIGLGLWALSAPARGVATRAALAAGPLVVGVGLWSPRPLLVGLAALVGLLLVIQEDRPGWLLVPLLWVWGNSHGSFPLAVGLVVLLVIGQLLEERRLPPARLRLLGWAAVGTVVAAVGPLGPDLLLFPLRVLGRREAMTGVVEWEPPSYGSVGELVWLGVALLPLVAARRGAGWSRLVPAIVVSLTAALALRNIAPAAIVVAAMVAPALARPVTDHGRTEAGTSDRSAARLARIIGITAGTALVVAVATVATSPGLDLQRYPVTEVDLLDGAGLLADDDIVVAHREAVGNYLTFRLGAGAAVFVDDRFDFHDVELLADHRDLLAGRNARAVLDDRAVDVVLWEVDQPLADWLTEAADWTVRTGDEWLIACRVGSTAEARCPTQAMLDAGRS